MDKNTEIEVEKYYFFENDDIQSFGGNSCFLKSSAEIELSLHESKGNLIISKYCSSAPNVKRLLLNSEEHSISILGLWYACQPFSLENFYS